MTIFEKQKVLALMMSHLVHMHTVLFVDHWSEQPSTFSTTVGGMKSVSTGRFSIRRCKIRWQLLFLNIHTCFILCHPDKGQSILLFLKWIISLEMEAM